MRLLVFESAGEGIDAFVSVVDAQGRNIASFYGALRYVEAAKFMEWLAK